MSDSWSVRLSEYLDGDLPAPEARDLELHLGACPACTRDLEGLRRVRTRLAELPLAEPQEHVWRTIRGRIEISPVTRQSRIGWFLACGAPAAALAAVISLWGFRLDPGPGFEEPSPDAGLSPKLGAPEGARVYGEAAAEWRDALLAERTEPDVSAVLASNLEPFDRAIEETRMAIEQEPGDPLLRQHLARLLQAQLRFLKRAGPSTESFRRTMEADG